MDSRSLLLVEERPFLFRTERLVRDRILGVHLFHVLSVEFLAKRETKHMDVFGAFALDAGSFTGLPANKIAELALHGNHFVAIASSFYKFEAIF
jgi:hypothetical protein